MKNKRKRGVPYLDSMDLEILEFLDRLNDPIQFGWSVLDIVKQLNIKHNNLKPHIDKLLNLNLICVVDITHYNAKGNKPNVNKKVGLSTVRAVNDFWLRDLVEQVEDKESIEEVKKEIENFKRVLKFLRSVRAYYYNIENKTQIDFDLRKATTQDRLINKRIKTLKKSRSKK